MGKGSGGDVFQFVYSAEIWVIVGGVSMIPKEAKLLCFAIHTLTALRSPWGLSPTYACSLTAGCSLRSLRTRRCALFGGSARCARFAVLS
jgi:hypothetical protein